MPNPFKQWSDEDIEALVSAFPLALLVHRAFRDPMVLPLPMLPDVDDSGRLVGLVGHMALHNPMVERVREDPQTLFVFLGPHAYVSPTIVSKPAWGPTWNYALAWMEAEITLRPGITHTALQRLVQRLEGDDPDSWTTGDMGERYEKLAKRIIAFEASVLSVNATFKLGQNEEAQVFDDILRGLDNEPLRQWMSRFDPRRR